MFLYLMMSGCVILLIWLGSMIFVSWFMLFFTCLEPVRYFGFLWAAYFYILARQGCWLQKLLCWFCYESSCLPLDHCCPSLATSTVISCSLRFIAAACALVLWMLTVAIIITFDFEYHCRAVLTQNVLWLAILSRSLLVTVVWFANGCYNSCLLQAVC